GRYAHEAANGEAVTLAAGGDKGRRLLRRHTGLLRLLAGVDLHEQAGRAALLLHLRGQGGRDPVAVHALDDVEQGDGLLRLVGLEGTYQVQLYVRILRAKRGPFRLRLLHAVLAEDALARRQ